MKKKSDSLKEPAKKASRIKKLRLVSHANPSPSCDIYKVYDKTVLAHPSPSIPSEIYRWESGYVHLISHVLSRRTFHDILDVVCWLTSALTGKDKVVSATIAPIVERGLSMEGSVWCSHLLETFQLSGMSQEEVNNHE